MYEQVREDTLFCMFYASVAMLSLTACCYLLFRRGNAFNPGIVPSARLRRWTAAFFASMTMSHLWYTPMLFLTSADDMMQNYLIGGLLDCMTVFPLAIGVLFSMLQDRRRPLWLIAAMVAPLVVMLAWCVAFHSNALLPAFYTYLLLLGIGIIIYMVRATRLYGRWLRDNYADLEHKEVWQSFVILAIILMVFSFYAFSSKGLVYRYLLQLNDIVLICFLLWRVETLSALSIHTNDAKEDESVIHCSQGGEAETAYPLQQENEEDNIQLQTIVSSIEPLLKRYCEEPQLYLQHDMSSTELAKQIGTNRSYLSKYFASQGITYNVYINNLRIQHFINLYREAVATHQPITIQQLALQSGFRNYGTFITAFKQRMGMTTTEWIQATIS